MENHSNLIGRELIYVARVTFRRPAKWVESIEKSLKKGLEKTRKVKVVQNNPRRAKRKA
jgi:hypothetical protein